jgi:DNA-directed RNA polymerase specialized sigma24 family protein
MIRCQEIQPEMWSKAGKRLVFYFGQRLHEDAEDLAQQTLLEVWRRNMELVDPDDFLKLCYGFARNVDKAAGREKHKHVAEALDPAMPEQVNNVGGMREEELSLFIEEVQQTAESNLKKDEWELIQEAMKDEDPDIPRSGRLRVKLLRARRKLKKLTGWRK